MSGIDLSKITKEQKAKYIDDAQNSIEKLQTQMLSISLSMSDVDYKDTDKIQEIQAFQTNINVQIESHKKVLAILKPVDKNALANSLKTVKIPPGLERFNPAEDCSDTYLEYIETKSIAVGNECADHHVSVLLFYIPEYSKYEVFIRKNMVGTNKSWEDLKDLFIKEFSPVDNESKARDLLHKFEWKQNESVRDAAYRFTKIAVRAKIDIDSVVFLQQFSNKAHYRIFEEFTKKWNINKIESFNQLEKELDDIEAALNRIDQIKNNNLLQDMSIPKRFSWESVSDSEPEEISANYAYSSNRSSRSRHSNNNNYKRYNSRSKSPSSNNRNNRFFNKSPSRNVRFADERKSNLPCHFYFIHKNGCVKGAQCDMSHDRASLMDKQQN